MPRPYLVIVYVSRGYVYILTLCSYIQLLLFSLVLHILKPTLIPLNIGDSRL